MIRCSSARACLTLLVIASLTPGALPDARAQQTERLGADRQPYALTISGGVSLGAYEAGLNWVILKALRIEQEAGRTPVPELVGVTGGSAGAINALISSLTWCQEGDGLGTVDKNLFHATWIPIGFKTLLPADGEGYKEEDGWLTRHAFGDIISDIKTLMRDGQFRPGCSVLLGLTVTRSDPAPMGLHGLRVTQQRVVIPLELSIVGGRPAFRPAIVKDRRELLGNTLYLAPTSRAGFLDHDAVLDAVLAASAFPLAFGRQRLIECVPVPSGKRKEDACPSGRPSDRGMCMYVTQHLDQETVACEDDFIDGGVFDNTPVGVAVAQIESSERVRNAARPVSYLYLEPDNRRLPPGPASQGRKPTKSATIAANMAFLTGAIRTARNYELHNVLRYQSWNEHTDDLGFKAAGLLGSLSQPPLPAGERDLQAAINDLKVFIDANHQHTPGLYPCTGPERPLNPGFSWSFEDAGAGAGILMRAMPCATAILGARPLNAGVRNGHARVMSRALAAIAARFRRARLRAARSDVANTLQFESYRQFLIDNIEQLDALAAALLLNPTQVNPLTQKIRDAASSILRIHGDLETFVRDSNQVLSRLQTILRRGRVTESPTDALPQRARESAVSASDALDRRDVDRLEKAAAEVSSRHRCAAMLLATTRDLPALTVSPPDEPPGETLDRLDRIRASATSAWDAVDCLAQKTLLAAVLPNPPADPVNKALADSMNIAERSITLVTPHLVVSRDLLALDSPAFNLDRIKQAQELAEQARRKSRDIHEDRALMLTTRYAPLASSYFGSFTGFLDEPLRQHDYLVGVYDGLYGIAEHVCRGQGVPQPLDPAVDDMKRWSDCITDQIGKLARSLEIDEKVVNALNRLEHKPEVKGEPTPGTENVEIILNALFDPKRCTESEPSAHDRCLVDDSFGAFVAGLERRGYTTSDPYMQQALDNPDFWWVTPAMHALRRMKVIEARVHADRWQSVSSLTQRALMPLEDRIGARLTVPSVLPPRFGWRQPWFRLSMTTDWIIAGQDHNEGRYRLRPIGFAAAGGRVAFYGDVGLRVLEEPTAEGGLVPEAGLAFAWRNMGAQYWLLSGLELSGHGALVDDLRPRLDVGAILLTHMRLGVGFDLDKETPYFFIGIDDPIGLAYSVASIWL